jgi:fumarate reductase subunit C
MQVSRTTTYLSISVRYLSYIVKGRWLAVEAVRASNWQCTVIASATVGMAGASRTKASTPTVLSTLTYRTK